jgi:hypothetical protein
MVVVSKIVGSRRAECNTLVGPDPVEEESVVLSVAYVWMDVHFMR